MGLALSAALAAGLFFSAVFAFGVVEAAAAPMSAERVYAQCQKELRGIGFGRGARERRFDMIENCVKRKRAKG